MTPEDIERRLSKILEDFQQAHAAYADRTTVEGFFNVIRRLRDAIREGKTPEELTHG